MEIYEETGAGMGRPADNGIRYLADDMTVIRFAG
jgi:hypothetical protein